MYRYKTDFCLTNCVNDLKAAQKYLSADNMEQYLKDDATIPERVRENVITIDWVLTDEISGYVIMQSEVKFTEEELEKISDWVRGENSDGLGEGFEQQKFACYVEEGLSGYSGDDVYIRASFDWKTNNYTFDLLPD